MDLSFVVCSRPFLSAIGNDLGVQLGGMSFLQMRMLRFFNMSPHVGLFVLGLKG